MTGLAESSALLLFDKAHDAWQMVFFFHSDTVATSTVNAAHGLHRESSERLEDQIHSRGRASLSQERLFYPNKCERYSTCIVKKKARDVRRKEERDYVYIKKNTIIKQVLSSNTMIETLKQWK